MSVEPVERVRPDVPDVAEVTVPEQVTVATPPPGVEPLDHVRSHSIKCYWDFVDCRWQCAD